MVEVGIFYGRLSVALLRARRDITLTMVDNWLGQEDQPARYLETGDYHAHLTARQQGAIKKTAIQRTAFAGHRRTVLHMDSALAASSFAPASVDMVFLDGDHSYEGVRRDCLAWRPIIRPGGWLGGHDYYGPDLQAKSRFSFRVKEAVDDLCRTEGWDLELDIDATWFVQLKED